MPRTTFKGGMVQYPSFFPLFPDSSSHRKKENWFISGPAVCVSESRARDGFPPSLSIFETGMRRSPRLMVFPKQTPNLPMERYAGFRQDATHPPSDIPCSLLQDKYLLNLRFLNLEI